MLLFGITKSKSKISQFSRFLLRFALRKRIEAWRLTVLASVMPSDGDGDPVGHWHHPTAHRLWEKAAHRFASTPCEDAPVTSLPSQDSNRPIRVLNALSLYEIWAVTPQSVYQIHGSKNAVASDYSARSMYGDTRILALSGDYMAVSCRNSIIGLRRKENPYRGHIVLTVVHRCN